ncbi:uncharacterized protein BKCO1_1600063 [Diplodia corticola]|uniref:Uncharacterized protein n=1 Tax=Diplodia corticola TaxID=236234 RepID=A0A1J9R4K9_9PEZI|nr:uncharacterized protein BKCO1_1600063 [Diplodia corticola]OJD35513.1 hypothetical protein BKCO1_1600063 [Diplodia corticola]
MTHSYLETYFAHNGMFRKRRTALRRHHSAPSLSGRFNAGDDVNTKPTEKVKPLDKATDEKDSQLDGNYEDDLAEAVRQSKLGAQSEETKAAILAEADEANLQKALRLSKEKVTLGSGSDVELQLALELSRVEAGHNEHPYDPDTFGETSRMGAMRNNRDGGVMARASVPDLDDRWDDEPPPPYEP